jgi:uncharacterized membrane protein HdeD (DUF308 family)
MRDYFHNHWWAYLLRGFALLFFGGFALAWPDLNLDELNLAFGIYLLTAGVIDIVIGIRSADDRKTWFLPLGLGVAEIGAAAFLLRNPGELTNGEFILTAGLILLAQGAVSIMSAFRDIDRGRLRMLFTALGIIAIVAGFALFAYADADSVEDYVWILGGFGLLSGAIAVASALDLKPDVERVARTTAREVTK